MKKFKNIEYNKKRRIIKMEQINIYSATELKKQFPEGFESAHKKWVDSVSNDGIFWQDEIMDSLKGIFKASGINLTNWEISDSSPSFVKFTIPTYWSELADYDMLVDTYTGKKALNWLKETLGLKSVKRVNYIGHDKKKHYRFDIVKSNGEDWDCDFTGYCADYDFLYSLLNDVTKENCTLSEAYHNLADVAGKLFEQEYIDQCSEEYFIAHADANDYQYTEEGKRI
jgi:hypothetical protein